jgi:NLI interacting factor-like phosphatase
MPTEYIPVLALDLEGTLISNAMSQIPRPHLCAFLDRCQAMFPRIVMFTTVDEPSFRRIAGQLFNDALVPAWFPHMEYVHWHGETKNLCFIPNSKPECTWLVDDFEKFVHPGQESQWIQVDFFDHPYGDTDTGLLAVLKRLEHMAR